MNFTRTAVAILWLVSASATSAAEPTTDVRVLIDVSGSMKDNDPANLRVPALKLLNGLMPLGAFGGIWMFAESVDLHLARGEVTAAWKQGAEDAAGAIHSRGQRTDIEAALRAATADWQKADANSRRSVILLTDGMVDTGSEAASAASRARILDERIAALEAGGAAVHVIALSAHADHDLLRSLAIRTGGWYERAEDAGQLERLFLRMFEKATQPDTVPIDGNRFGVDASIDEMTVLVFREPTADKLRLLAPDQSPISAAAPGDGVAWRAGNGYDMVTISKPRQGQWQIDGEVDPDNRVMVVTNLRLEVEGLPSYVMPGASLPVGASLSESGVRVVRADFLQLIGMNTIVAGVNGDTQDLIMLDDGDGGDTEPADGQFGATFASGDDEGVVQVTVTADSGTFLREKRFSLEVLWPAAARIETGEMPQLVVTPRVDVIDAATLVARATLVLTGGEQRVVDLVAGEDGVLRALLADSDAGGDVKVTIEAKTLAGEPLAISLPALALVPVVALPIAEPEATQPAAAESEPVPEPPGEVEPPDWTMVAAQAVVANLLAGALLFAFSLWRKRRRNLELAACEAALSPAG